MNSLQQPGTPRTTKHHKQSSHWRLAATTLNNFTKQARSDKKEAQKQLPCRCTRQIHELSTKLRSTSVVVLPWVQLGVKLYQGVEFNDCSAMMCDKFLRLCAILGPCPGLRFPVCLSVQYLLFTALQSAGLSLGSGYAASLAQLG